MPTGVPAINDPPRIEHFLSSRAADGQASPQQIHPQREEHSRTGPHQLGQKVTIHSWRSTWLPHRHPARPGAAPGIAMRPGWHVVILNICGVCCSGGESLPGLAPHQLLTEGIQTQLAQRLAQVLTATLAFPGPPQALTYDSSSTHAPSLLATAFGGAGSLELIQAG